MACSSTTLEDAMAGPLDPNSQRSGATRRTAVGLILGAPLLGACAGMGNPFGSQSAGPAQQPQAVGTGGVKVGLILPLSASGIFAGALLCFIPIAGEFVIPGFAKMSVVNNSRRRSRR